MAVYLSPGVYLNEVDLSVLPSNTGPIRPAFIGTAVKGPLNTPVLLTNSQEAIDVFGPPSPTSFLQYALQNFFEQGNQCYGMRVGIECQLGQAPGLAAVCIDTGGTKHQGWGRIPLYSGVDFARISLAGIPTGGSISFHAATIQNIVYNAANPAAGTVASLTVTGLYTRSVDDTYVVMIISGGDLTTGHKLNGCNFEVIRGSDSAIVATGTLSDPGNTGNSQVIQIGDGMSIQVKVTSGKLAINDSFTFNARADNRTFQIQVGSFPLNSYVMPAATYSSVAAFVAAANALLLPSEQYVFASHTLLDGVTVVPQIQGKQPGYDMQVKGSAAWATSVGIQQWAFDIPRSYLLGSIAGPYNITPSNNTVVINNVPGTAGSTTTITCNLPAANGQSVASVAGNLNACGVVGGFRYYEALPWTIPGGEQMVLIRTTMANPVDQLVMMANFTNLDTLNFAQTVGIPFPYQNASRGFLDFRVSLPPQGILNPGEPLSCEQSPSSATCIQDMAYYNNIVGYFVATSPGSWLDGFSVSISVFTQGVGDPAGRYQITVYDSGGATVDVIQDVSFDQTADRYVGNVLNPGTKYGGRNGDAFINWEARPSFLQNDPLNSPSTYQVRNPIPFAKRPFVGMADGIPTDPTLASALDGVVIGNPALSTGIFAFQNPEGIDINVLATPGFTSGAVIGQALQICESRGDVIYLVDPPFGLRPQQVIDWHNGMLLSDLANAINSSYGALYWSWVQQFDQFNQINIWVPPSGRIAGVYSKTGRDAEQWFAPAGLKRGRLLTALAVEYSPTQGERDLLYGGGNAVNPLVAFPQDGIVVWGQRTLQRQASALDRVSVRMLLIFIKKTLVQLLRQFVFEPNDTTLWSQVNTVINPFMADILARRGLTGYKVVCDATNNTPERIDRNELWVSVFLIPTRAVEFVVLNLVVLRTGASFATSEVLAAAGIVQGQ